MTRMKKLTNAARKEISMNAAISTVFFAVFYDSFATWFASLLTSTSSAAFGRDQWLLC